MSLEAFLAVKEALRTDVDTRIAIDRIVECLGMPVLTILQITKLAAALGDSRHPEKHYKHLTRLRYAACITLPPALARDPAIQRLRIQKVYAAGPVLTYLAALAQKENPSLSDAELARYFSPPAFFENEAAQPL